jgi:histidinol dehydrogenase
MKIYTYPSKSAEQKIERIVKRGLVFTRKEFQQVSRILNDVRRRGDRAVIGYVNRFDAPRLSASALKVTPEEFSDASKRVDRGFIRTLNRAIEQIEGFHRQQIRKSWMYLGREGALLGQMVNPVERAGVYVPGARGGRTPLVSSVLMGAIPARMAGVKEIVMATPPTEAGQVDPHLLVAAGRVGVGAVYKIGSAWGIGALAYGTETIPRVDVIVGPGNIYVTLAKKMVAGTVGIDMVAGPSEILVVADDTAIPEYIAADLLSQAEHDARASAVLVTDSRRIAKEVAASLELQLKSLGRREIAAESLARYGAILLVHDIETALKLANRIAPEHLELLTADPFAVVGQIKNAGAVFVGPYTPEPVGDYLAGPNHVLPTAGTARFSSALSVDNFIKTTSVIRYSKAAFQREAKDIIRLAETEGLGAHANAVKVRMQRGADARRKIKGPET